VISLDQSARQTALERFATLRRSCNTRIQSLLAAIPGDLPQRLNRVLASLQHAEDQLTHAADLCRVPADTQERPFCRQGDAPAAPTPYEPDDPADALVAILGDLERSAEVATPGPWRQSGPDSAALPTNDSIRLSQTNATGRYLPDVVGNIRFLVTARNTVDDLVRLARALIEENRRLRKRANRAGKRAPC
jgi:hypothetical protein